MLSAALDIMAKNVSTSDVLFVFHTARLVEVASQYKVLVCD